MEYRRVLPRDLFNEAKLLKCLGHLTLAIHDGDINGISFEYSGDPFKISLSDAGYTAVSNLYFYLKSGAPINFYTTYNSRAVFPLEFEVDGVLGDVFTEDGDFTEEFLECLMEELKKYNCACGAEIQSVDGRVIKGCEHYPLYEPPYLSPHKDKEPEKVGNIKI